MDVVGQVMIKNAVMRKETPAAFLALAAQNTIGKTNALIQDRKLGLNNRRTNDGFPRKEGRNGLRGIETRILEGNLKVVPPS